MSAIKYTAKHEPETHEDIELCFDLKWRMKTPKREYPKCVDCEGSGKIEKMKGDFYEGFEKYYEECKNCRGVGHIIPDICFNAPPVPRNYYNYMKKANEEYFKELTND